MAAAALLLLLLLLCLRGGSQRAEAYQQVPADVCQARLQCCM
jgi:hypothetical protein